MTTIEARGLAKRYRSTLAVDGLTFDVRPGTVTGFLGPNGAGKSTTMRMIMGLDRPDAGQVMIGRRAYGDLRWPLREVGALLEAKAFHPGRTARAHLTALAASNAIAPRRVEEVLALTGMEKAAGRRAGKFSLGMSQRLGIAAALLGDPGVLLLDEPVNGLDPEGIRWIRNLMKNLAAQGRTVLVSSHLISEIAHTADALIVIGRGRLLAQTTVARLSARTGSLEPALIALIGLGLGALVRHTAGGICALVGVLFVLPLLFISPALQDTSQNFLPHPMANAMTAVKPLAHTLSPWLLFALLCLYAVLALAAGAWSLTRRDA